MYLSPGSTGVDRFGEMIFPENPAFSQARNCGFWQRWRLACDPVMP
jgi:hypothetical protein